MCCSTLTGRRAHSDPSALKLAVMHSPRNARIHVINAFPNVLGLAPPFLSVKSTCICPPPLKMSLVRRHSPSKRVSIQLDTQSFQPLDGTPLDCFSVPFIQIVRAPPRGPPGLFRALPEGQAFQLGEVVSSLQAPSSGQPRHADGAAPTAASPGLPPRERVHGRSPGRPPCVHSRPTRWRSPWVPRVEPAQ